MLLTIEGLYEDGKVLLKEEPVNIDEKTEVLVTFLSKNEKRNAGERKLGVWQGKYKVSDDFNEPIEDLKDYM